MDKQTFVLIGEGKEIPTVLEEKIDDKFGWHIKLDINDKVISFDNQVYQSSILENERIIVLEPIYYRAILVLAANTDTEIYIVSDNDELINIKGGKYL